MESIDKRVSELEIKLAKKDNPAIPLEYMERIAKLEDIIENKLGFYLPKRG